MTALARAGTDRLALGRVREVAAGKARDLRARIAPFFLRREKKDVFPARHLGLLFHPNFSMTFCACLDDTFCNQRALACGIIHEPCNVCSDAAASDAPEPAAYAGEAPQANSMPRKNDLVVWLRLQPEQQRIYEVRLNWQEVKQAFWWSLIFQAVKQISMLPSGP